MRKATTQKKKSKTHFIIISLILLLGGGIFFFGKWLMVKIGTMVHKEKIDSETQTTSSIIADAKEQSIYGWQMAWRFMTKGIIDGQ